MKRPKIQRKSPSDWGGTSTEDATRCQNQAFARLAKRDNALIDRPPGNFPAGLDLDDNLIASKDDSIGREPVASQSGRPPSSDFFTKGRIGNTASNADLPAQAPHPHHAGSRLAETQSGLGHPTRVAYRDGGEQFGSIKLSKISLAVEASKSKVLEGHTAIDDIQLSGPNRKEDGRPNWKTGDRLDRQGHNQVEAEQYGESERKQSTPRESARFVPASSLPKSRRQQGVGRGRANRDLDGRRAAIGSRTAVADTKGASVLRNAARGAFPLPGR